MSSRKSYLKAQLRKGIKVEMEHGHNFPKNLRKYIAGRIARDHLRENKKYYIKLMKAGL